MFKFSNNTVTILRKRGKEYYIEHISTSAVLPSTSLNATSIRKSVIERLRKDPSVAFVLESTDGHCEEEYLHPSGFRFFVSIQEGDNPSALLKVTYKDSLAFEDTFASKKGEEKANGQVGADEADEFNPEDDILNCVKELLYSIEEEDYYFVMDSCPFFVRKDPGEEINLHKASELLKDAGFQTEKLSVVGWVNAPVLFVHENDIVLIGSRHFDGQYLFMEMKRFFNGVSVKTVEEAVARVKETDYSVIVIHWEDGSWSFRTEMDEETDVDNFMEKINEYIATLRTFISCVEDQDGVGEEPWDTMSQQRHYFIHETLEESVKLSSLKV